MDKLNEASTLTLKGTPSEITKQLQDLYSDGKISVKTLDAALKWLNDANKNSANIEMNVKTIQGAVTEDRDDAFSRNTQSGTVRQGEDAQVSSPDWNADPDRPLGVQEPDDDGIDNGDNNNESDSDESISDDNVSDDGGGAVTPINADTGNGASHEGLDFFRDHFKDIAIVAGAAAILASIIALVKTLSKSIKVRYNKCVKTLQRAQKDFTLEPDGLNMKAVLPGVGSRLNDWLSRLFTWNWKTGENPKTKGNIGLYPFCNRYKDEIGYDYDVAKKAFSKIRATVDAGGEINSSVDNTYKSFHEALISGALYEGYGDGMNESVIMSLAAPIILTGIKVGAGLFKAPRVDKDGKIIPNSEVGVQVTKESTREICYAIINNFADKYINMDAVFKKLGIDTKSLSDLDMSSYEKLIKIIEAYSKPEPNTYTKQYTRIKAAYDKMLKHYYTIGDGIIDNFKKYTVAEDEKHANLLIASSEKLKNMWDTQKDIYNNNFSHVVIEIISSPNYVNYLNFILNYVMPVFKSGLAGNADYVLDLNPKKNEYYVIKQTGNNDALGGKTDIPEGKSVLVKIEGFNKEKKEISFKILGLVKRDYDIIDGSCDLTGFGTDDIDFNAYTEDGNPTVVTIPYGKWLALDPTSAVWEPFTYSEYRYNDTKKIGTATVEVGLFGEMENDKSDAGYTKLIYVSFNPKYNDVIGVTYITVDSPISNDNFSKLAYETDFPSSGIIGDGRLAVIKSCKNKNEVELGNIKDVEIYLKDHNPGIPIPVKSSDLYKKEGDDADYYIYADADPDLESERVENVSKLNEDDTLDPSGDGADNKNIFGCYACKVKKGSDLAKGDPEKMDFNGAYINLNPCSIKEFDTKMSEMGYAVEKDNAKAIKKNIRLDIQSQTGTIKTVSLKGKFDINTIDKAIDQISVRVDDLAQILNKADSLADEILKIIDDKKSNNKLINDKSENKDIKYPYLKDYDKDQNQKDVIHRFQFNVGTGIKNIKSPNNYDINISVDGFLGKNNETILVLGLKNRLVINSNKFGTCYYPANISKDSIKAAIEKLVTLVKNKQVVDPSIKGTLELASGKTTSGNATEKWLDSCIDELLSVLNFNSPYGISTKNDKGVSEKLIGISLNIDVDKKSNKLFVNFKDFANNKLYKFEIHAAKSSTGAVNAAIDGDGNYVANSPDAMRDSIKKWFKAKSGQNNNAAQSNGNTQQNGQNSQTNNTQQSNQNGATNQQGGAQNAKPQSEPQNSSVSYNVTNSVSESKSNLVKINRRIDGRFKNAYILSDAIYEDYMNNAMSKLDESAFVSSLVSKDDCIKFAKQNVNAHFVKFQKNLSYEIPFRNSSLYESCIVVEFNDNDRIIRKINFGKTKIS